VLSPRVKSIFALGDHTLNLTLSALSLFYLYYLSEYVGLRPSLASVVLLIGRCVDAFADPLMGRLSDHTHWKLGRRRPYFLLGAVPFGVSFALLWVDYPVESQLAKFGIYSLVYLVHSLTSTVLAVPYMALLPELTLDYQERTSINTYRSVASVLGTLVPAVAFRPVAEAFGGGTAGFAWTGLLAGIWVVLPWFGIYRATWERSTFRDRVTHLSFVEGMRALVAHAAYRRLAALYLCSRIAMDVVAAMYIFYFQYWLRRPGDFEVSLLLLLLTVVASLPFWLRVSQFRDKAHIFIIGTTWWIAISLVLFIGTPETPRWVIFAVSMLAGVGYAVADMMPWSMLGETMDDDELRTGERREGLYAGFFTFLRKLGGASAVTVAGVALELSGFVGGQAQPESVLLAIRVLTALAPAFFLVCAVALAIGYPITRARHKEILQQIAARRA